MTHSISANSASLATIMTAVDRATAAIPPLWPLDANVAVNPFLGQTSESLAQAGARLALATGARITMPRPWYDERIRAQTISDTDLREAWRAAPAHLRPDDLAALKAAAAQKVSTPRAHPTITTLASDLSGIDWPRLIAERISVWASAYFDEGQALWAAPKGPPYAAWQAFATHDLTPEVHGLAGFARFVADAPAEAAVAIARAADRLGLEGKALESYCYQMLMSLGGWAQIGRYRQWQAELQHRQDQSLTDLLAIRLVWEEALYTHYQGPLLAERWTITRAAHAAPITPSADLVVDEILQDAAERAAQRPLLQSLSGASVSVLKRPRLQAVFCIDVRSEILRRALESVDPAIQTLGFAGFFGLRLAHRAEASVIADPRLPVLLKPTVTSSCRHDEQTEEKARIAARAKRAWGRFKLSAVSSFSFVEAVGPLYIGKLVRDGLAFHRPASPIEPKPSFDPPPALAIRIETAASVLRAMSLTDGFAPLVVLVGHGSHVANNPHASALQCGACGGYAGDVNARLLASLLNDREVRAVLATQSVIIPDDTLFVGALHDTTTDEINLFGSDHPSPAHRTELAMAERWFAAAGKLARGERALRLPQAVKGAHLLGRGREWAQIRPEWGLAGCHAFIAAPRARTRHESFKGRAFLNDYDWTRDPGFGVLELILTAPVVVASWISLQYYGSTVAPEIFGSGNKLLHNVIGGIGVGEGNGGPLRPGLPWQSVHDGESYAHEPLRLSVFIEAPHDAVSDVLRRHQNVRDLFDHKWLHLFTLEDNAKTIRRYVGNLEWSDLTHTPATAIKVDLMLPA